LAAEWQNEVMHMKVSLLLILLAAINFFGAAAPAGQSQTKEAYAFVQENKEKRAQNPEGLLFTAAFKNNQKQFHHGETLKLELSFATSKPKTYILDNATYDRSGRLDIDDFVVDREDSVVDPLDDYFNSALFGFIGGGLRGNPELTNKPELISAELNEWMRFDKPGRYRVYVVSHRVSKMKAAGDQFHSTGQVAVSNVIEFEILPLDKRWSTQKLNEAVTMLTKPDGDHRSACRTLRFLGTAAAVGEMIKRFRGEDDTCDFQYEFGLIGSPQRDFVIREMENALTAPEQPVITAFVNTLALLAFTEQSPPLPPYPGDENKQQADQWMVQLKERRSAFDQFVVNYVRQLLAAVPRKAARARAASLQTIVDYDWELNTDDSTQARTLLASISEVFTRLPLDEQTRLLTSHWKTIANPAMVPVLREILKRPDDEQHLNEIQELRSIALVRLFEESPDEGRRIILDEIRHPTSRFKPKTLRSLPDETLPELDNLLAANLEESRGPKGTSDTEVVSMLIERYATDSILPRVRAVFDAPGVGKWACAIQASLVAYFLRVDPPTGGEYLNKALAARGEGFTGCYSMTLVDVAQRQMSPEVEAAAVATVDDDNPEVVSQAARVLAQYGSADAESALWRRLEKLNEAPQSQASIEHSLMGALTRGQAWLATPDKLRRLRDLCRADGNRHEVDELIRTWNTDIYLTLFAADGELASIGVAHYQLNSVAALKKKLLQFPTGTVFHWKAVAAGRSAEREKQLFDEMKTYVEQHGMQLQNAAERPAQ